MSRYRTGRSDDTDGAAHSRARAIAWPGAVLLVAAAIALLSMMGCGGDEGGQDGKSAAEKKKAQEKQKQAKKAKKKQKVELTDAGKKLSDRAEEYVKKLKQIASQAGSTSAGQMASAWADLSEWCSQNGLPGAAARCWYQARRSGSLNDATRQKLGLTETVAGVPVTPDQQKFLQNLRTRVKIYDVTGSEETTKLTLPDGSSRELSSTTPVEMQIEPGFTRMQYQGGGNGNTTSFVIEGLPGFSYEVRMKPASTAPTVFWPLVAALHRSYSQWQQSKTAQRRVLMYQGARVQQGGDIDYEGDSEENLKVISIAGRLRAVAPEGESLTVDMQQGVLRTNALLYTRESKQEPTWNVFAPSGQGGVRIERLGNSDRAQHASAFYYELERRFSRPMANLLGAIDKGVRKQLARHRLQKRRRDIELRATVMEADGKFKGAWEAENWKREQFLLARNEIRRQVRRQRRVGRLSIALDRAAELKNGDRVENMWANWPHYRQALAQVLSRSADTILDRIRMVNKGAGGHGHGHDSSGSYPIDYLALFPDELALERINGSWRDLGPEAKLSGVRVIGMLERSRAIEKLSSLPAESDDDEVVAAAYRELAELGGQSVTEYLGGPGVGETEKAAMVTARALLGQPDALESLPDAVSNAPDIALRVATRAENPMAGPVVAALSELSEAGDGGGGGGGSQRGGPSSGGRGGMPGPAGGVEPLDYSDGAPGEEDEEEGPRAAPALTRLGDIQATRELLRLVSGDRDLTPKMVETVTDSALPLLVGPALGKIRDDSADVAIALGERRPEGALELLKKDASGGDNPMAGLALAAWGTPETIKAAAGQAGSMKVSHLVSLYESWNLQGVDDTGRWTWREGVDQQAAAGLLDSVAKNGSSGKARLAAVLMARESGSTMSADTLLAAASASTQQEEDDGDEEQQQSPRGGPRGGGPRGGGPGPSMRGPRGGPMGSGPYGQPRQQQQDEEDDKPWDLSGHPGLRILGIYAEAAESGLAEGLQELARNAAAPDVQARAARMIAERNMPDAPAILGDMAQSEEADSSTRAAAARALGMTGAPEAGQTLVQLYQQAQDDTVRAGACHGLAELSGRIGAQQALPGGTQQEMTRQFIELAAQSGSGGGASTELQAAAVRAAAHLGAFDSAQNARVLKGLEERFGWKPPQPEQQQRRRRGSLYPSPGPMRGGRSGRRSPGPGRGGQDDDSGSSHPVTLRLAVAEAASVLTGHNRFGALADRAAGALRNEDDLADAWQDRAVDLVRMGKEPCLQFVARRMDILELDTLAKLPALAAEVDDPPATYYTVLAHAASTREDAGGEQRRRGGRGGMMDMMRSNPTMQASQWAQGRQQQQQEQPLLPDPELDEPHRWQMMQWGCVEALKQAPEQVLSPILTEGKTGLVNNPQVGPVAAVYLADRVSGFNVTSYLPRYFTSHGGADARRNGLIAARRAGADAASDVVRGVLAGQLEARSGGRRGPSGGPAAMDPLLSGGPGREKQVNIKLYAARVLGSMGQQGTLGEAWRRGSSEIATAAGEGMAFLPPDQNAVRAMRSLPGKENPEAKRVLNRAVTTAARVML
ncbi:MAG: HEAT repeat domain-containing protein, partial [Planctomycetota bacterium]